MIYVCHPDFSTTFLIGGGGAKQQQNYLKFKFGHLKTHAGVSIFQKCLNYKFLSDPILKKKNLTLNLTLFNVNMPK